MWTSTWIFRWNHLFLVKIICFSIVYIFISYWTNIFILLCIKFLIIPWRYSTLCSQLSKYVNQKDLGTKQNSQRLLAVSRSISRTFAANFQTGWNRWQRSHLRESIIFTFEWLISRRVERLNITISFNWFYKMKRSYVGQLWK